MDGLKNVTTEKEHRTDNNAKKKSEVKITRAKSREKDVNSVSKAVVLQKGGKGGPHHSPPSTSILGITTDAGTASDVRSRSGGRPVEVRGPNPESGCCQLHPGESVATPSKNGQQDTIDVEKPAKLSDRPTAENKDVSLNVQYSALDSSADNRGLRIGCSSNVDSQNLAPKPAPRTPTTGGKVPAQPSEHAATPHVNSLQSTENRRSSVKSAESDNKPETHNLPKPAPRTPVTDKDLPKLLHCSTTDGLPPKPLPRSGKLEDRPIDHKDDQAPKAAPRSARSPPRLEDVQENTVSNDQFIADENVSIWSSSTNIDRPQSMENICRICHESDQMEPLISPCLCRGTLSLVHRTCLQHWLAESDSSSCELCRFMYLTKRVPKYSVMGSVVAWIRQNRRQRKALLADTLGMIAFVPFATMITYVAAALADGLEYQESPSWTDVTIRFAVVTFISMMTTIDVAYATYWMLRAQHHFSTWYSWYRRNSDVTLLPHPQQ